MSKNQVLLGYAGATRLLKVCRHTIQRMVRKGLLTPHWKKSPKTGRLQRGFAKSNLLRVKDQRTLSWKNPHTTRDGVFIHYLQAMKELGAGRHTLRMWAKRGTILLEGIRLRAIKRPHRNSESGPEEWYDRDQVEQIKKARANLSDETHNDSTGRYLSIRAIKRMHHISTEMLAELEVAGKLTPRFFSSRRWRGVQIKTYPESQIEVVNDERAAFFGTHLTPEGKRFNIAAASKLSLAGVEFGARDLRQYVKKSCPALPEGILPSLKMKSPATGYREYTILESDLLRLSNAVRAALSAGKQEEKWKDIWAVARFYHVSTRGGLIRLNEALGHFRKNGVPFAMKIARPMKNGRLHWLWAYDTEKIDKIYQPAGDSNRQTVKNAPPASPTDTSTDTSTDRRKKSPKKNPEKPRDWNRVLAILRAFAPKLKTGMKVEDAAEEIAEERHEGKAGIERTYYRYKAKMAAVLKRSH